ncbi:MAG: two pore domain potassium channel family protein [Polyangiaceae bacterium]|nr:two pore domain potassium channel family protein [Polyangiaceae bacterium]
MDRLQRTPQGELGAIRDQLRALARKDPADALAALVLGAGWLFWRAERGKNPGLKSAWDAIVFVSTCLSVGYHNVFAVTPAGKAITTFVMTYGPSLAAAALEPTAAERADEAKAAARAQAAIVSRLDAIVAALRRNEIPTR